MFPAPDGRVETQLLAEEKTKMRCRSVAIAELLPVAPGISHVTPRSTGSMR